MHFAHYVDTLYSITLIDPEQRVVALKISFFYLAVLCVKNYDNQYKLCTNMSINFIVHIK